MKIQKSTHLLVRGVGWDIVLDTRKSISIPKLTMHWQSNSQNNYSGGINTSQKKSFLPGIKSKSGTGRELISCPDHCITEHQQASLITSQSKPVD